MRINFAGGAYKGRSNAVSSEEAINLFFEAGDAQGEGSMVNVPGARTFAQCPAGKVRGMHTLGDFVYAVVGDKLMKVGSQGEVSEVGLVGSTSSNVSMADNGASLGQQLAIADGGSLKIFDITTSELTVTSSPNTSSVGFIDGYFVFVHDGTGQFGWTTLYDGTIIDPGDNTTAAGDADNLVGLKVDRRQIWLTGKDTTEVFYNSGGDPPFTQFQGGFNHSGCVSPHTVVRLDNGVAWLSSDEHGHGVPVISWDYNPKPLTAEHPQVAYQFSNYKRLDDAIAYVYKHEAHEFYVLTLPSEDVTWVYDASTKHWHKRSHTIGNRFGGRERYNCHAFAFNKHLVGDFENGKIYHLDSMYYSLDGEIIPNIRTTHSQRKPEEDRINIRSVQLTGEEGTGGTVWLESSRDGGYTWADKREASFGDIGKFSHRCIWRKFKQGRDWAFRVTRKIDAKTIYNGMIAKEDGES